VCSTQSSVQHENLGGGGDRYWVCNRGVTSYYKLPIAVYCGFKVE